METSLPAPPAPVVAPPPPRFIAPWWHTLLLVAVLLIFSALGSAGHPGLDHAMRMRLYIGTIVMEWLMVLYILWGIRRAKQTTLSELIGGRWKTPEDFLLDIATAAGFWIVALLVLGGIGYALGMDKIAHAKDMQQRVGSMLPSGKNETITWILLCITAGFCEEVIFRGYFQSQFGMLLKSAWAGIIVQGLIFGGSHAYEGQAMIVIAAYGILFGILAHWRKTLRPGMMAHFTHDMFQGLFAQKILEHALKAMPK